MKLQDIRKSKGLTAKELSILSGVNVRNIQQYECGQRNIDGANLESLCDLALTLGVKLTDLIEDENLIVKVKKSV